MFDDNKHGDKFSRMSNISPEEYRRLELDYNSKIERVCELVQKILIGFAIGLGISFVLVNGIALFNQSKNYGDGVGSYYWLAVELLLAMCLYDPKLDQKFIYEKDYAVLLRNLDRKLKLDTIRMRLSVVFGVAFSLMNVLAWYLLIFNLVQAAG